MERRTWTPWLTYLATLLSAWPLGAIVAASHPLEGDACSGIGFGCSRYGWDLAGFLLMFLGIPYAFGLLIVLVTLSLVGDQGRVVPTVAAVVGLAVPWVFVLALAPES